MRKVREVLRLRHALSLSYREISEALGVGKTAAGEIVRRAEVVTRHVLPNAAVPIVTIFGFMMGSLIGGAVIVESVFSWPGIGRLLVSSVQARDLAVVQVILLLIGAMMVISNLLIDLLYGLIDPRMRSRDKTETA